MGYGITPVTISGNLAVDGTASISGTATIRPIVTDRGSYDHSLAPLTITNQTPTGTTLNDSLPVLNLCRQGVGGVSYGARATLCLSRFQNPDNVWSRTRLDFKLATDTYNDILSMTMKSDGTFVFYPNQQYINNQNGAYHSVNFSVGCYTTGTQPATSTFLNCSVADGWNAIDTITTLSCGSRANDGFFNESRMVLDGSYNTNVSRGNRGSYIYWQSINSAGNAWMTNVELYTITNPSSVTCIFNVNGSVRSNQVTLTSSGNIKEKVRDIYEPLDLINKFEGKHYHNKLTGEKDFGLIAEDIEKICPCLTSRYDDTGVEIGVKYMNLTALLIEGIKELNKNNKYLKDEINRIKEFITLN
jgi:hypothetical protein